MQHPATTGTGAGATRAPARGRGRFSTRRRLIAAFSAVVAAVVSLLTVQIIVLRRMESTFAEMKEHDAEMLLALELEDAARVQYDHEARFVLGDRAELRGYDEQRARGLGMICALGERVDEPETVAAVERIRETGAELDRIFRAEVATADAGDPKAILAVQRSYPLVSRIDRLVDDLIAGLQHRTSRGRDDLVALETAAVRWTAALLVAVPLFVAAAVLYLSRSVAKPLARLSEGAGALAAGDLDARIDIDTPDEFGALAGEFNAMTVALKEHQDRLVDAEKAAGIGRLAAGIAHELNNPLQVMLGYLSLNRDVPDARLARQLAAAEDEALRCKDIVAGLLELSRPAVDSTAVDLHALCEDVAAAVGVSLRPSTLHLSMEGGAIALGDRQKLRQVLFNLIRNAVEAAGPGGDVMVSLGASGGWAEVAVSDTGPGVPPETRARLFEPFFTTKAAGKGLGLAVSRAIAIAHGGDIEVRNNHPAGAVFTLRVPRAPEGRN